jgi:DNA polymerase III subunit gamma/tau
MLTKEGANAFLKTLEEPPAHAVFILATTEPERLPVTILSRCQRYAFRRIAIPVMIERMKAIAQAEAIEIDDAAVAAIAYRADGGLRDALTMLEQAAAFAGGERVTQETLDLAFGATGRNFAQSLADAVIARDAAAVLSTIETASDAGSDMQVLTRSLIAAFRNLLVARVDPALLARDLAPEDAQRAAAHAGDASQATLVRILRTLTEALSLARSGGNARLELETALLRFVLAPEEASLDALAGRITALEERVDGSSHAPEAPAQRRAQPQPQPPPRVPQEREATKAAPSSPAARPAAAKSDAPAAPLSLQKVRAAWQNIRGKVESERQSLRAPLSRAAIDAVESNAIVLKLPDAWSADALRDHAPLIEAAILDVLEVPLKITLRVDNAARSKGSAPGGVASVTEDADADDPDALFNYANERIR